MTDEELEKYVAMLTEEEAKELFYAALHEDAVNSWRKLFTTENYYGKH